jgi:hypothetical protein
MAISKSYTKYLHISTAGGVKLTVSIELHVKMIMDLPTALILSPLRMEQGDSQIMAGILLISAKSTTLPEGKAKTSLVTSSSTHKQPTRQQVTILCSQCSGMA